MQVVARLIALAAVVLLAGCGFGHARASRRNEEILHELSTPAGARVLSVKTYPYYGDDEAAPPEGYATLVRFVAARAATPRSIAAFYARELRADGWTCGRREERVPRGTYVSLQCVRKHQLLGVNTDSMYGRPPHYELSIDADAKALG